MFGGALLVCLHLPSSLCRDHVVHSEAKFNSYEDHLQKIPGSPLSPGAFAQKSTKEVV